MPEQALVARPEVIVEELVDIRRLVAPESPVLSAANQRALAADRLMAELEVGYPIPTWVDNASRAKSLPNRVKRVARIAALSGYEVPRKSSDVETLTTIGDYL